MEKPQPRGKRQHTIAGVDRDMLHRLKVIAVTTSRSMGACVNEALADWLERQEKEEK